MGVEIHPLNKESEVIKMAIIDTKKQIVAQANNATAPKVTPTVNPAPTSINTGVKANVVNNSSISSPKINQYSTTTTKGVATPPKTTTKAVPNYTSTLKAPASPVDILKPSLDAGRKRDEAYLTEWQKQSQAKLDAEYKDQVNQLQLSKQGAENEYNSNKDDLGETLYNQNEITNLDAQNRGISYSPQALGLQGVHNINYNKNLTKLMQTKSTLLADIDSKINSLGVSHSSNLTDLNLEMLKQRNDGSKDYDKQLNDALMMKYGQDYEKYLTDDERAYQRYLTDDERAYNKANPYNGYSSGGYSKSNFKPYARTPWEDWSSKYSSSGSGVDYADNSVLNAGIDSYKKASTDAYNNISKSDTTPTLNNYFDMSSLYNDSMSLYDDAFTNAPQKYKDELAKTKKVADDHMFNRAKSNSTNTPYKSGNTYITPALPWNKKTIVANKAKGNVISKVRKGNDFGAKIDSNAFDIHKKITSSKPKTAPKKKTVTKKPVKTKYENNLEKNIKKQVKKSVSNVKKNIAKLFGHKTKPKNVKKKK